MASFSMQQEFAGDDARRDEQEALQKIDYLDTSRANAEIRINRFLDEAEAASDRRESHHYAEKQWSMGGVLVLCAGVYLIITPRHDQKTPPPPVKEPLPEYTEEVVETFPPVEAIPVASGPEEIDHGQAA